MPIPPLYAHEGIRHRLVGAIASGRLPQALLFEGPTGVGKQRLGLWLAQALVCERAGERAGVEAGEGCGECQQCKLVLNLSHPDVHWFVPLELSKKGDADKQVDLTEEALGEEMAARRQQPLYEPPSGLASHGIAAVRLLLRRLVLTPALSRRKVFLIGDAERLVPQTGAEAAANALLKALEEPPSGSSPRWKQVRCAGTRSRSACSRFRHEAGSPTCWTACSSSCGSKRGPAARPGRWSKRSRECSKHATSRRGT